MRVDHGCCDVLVAEELLDGADVVAGLEKVGCETVAQGVAGGGLGDARGADGAVDGALHAGLVEVVPPDDPGARVPGEGWRRKEPEPSPLSAGGWVFSLQGTAYLLL